MIKFKERTESPKAIRLAFTPNDMSKDDYENKMKGNGWFCLGYHFVLHENGVIEKGIPLEQYADPSLPEWKDSIYVIVMAITISDVQKFALRKLEADLKLPIVMGD